MQVIISQFFHRGIFPDRAAKQQTPGMQVILSVLRKKGSRSGCLLL
jgi:hypothetical protein